MRLFTVLTLSILFLSGCSSAPLSEADATAATSLRVVDARTEPGMIDLNRDLQPMKTALVIADVKDYTSRVTDVKLQFSKIPLEVPMKKISGSTWQAEFTPRQLEMLAVSGKTMKYEAQIVAKNEDGQVAMSNQPLEVEVRAPKLSETSG